jgi:hypothetical protein
MLQSEIHELINSIWNKEELPDQWKESIIVQFTRRTIQLTNNYRGMSLQTTSYRILSCTLLSMLSPYVDEIIEDHQISVGFVVTDQLLIRSFAFVRYCWRLEKTA